MLLFDMDQRRRILRFLIVVSLCHCRLVQSQANGSSYPTSVSTPWETSLLKVPHASFLDGSNDRRILVSGKLDFKYACGFYCNDNCDAFLFGVFIIQTNMTSGDEVPPTVVWSANRNRLVGKHADLKLTADDGLVLRDSDGSIAWKIVPSGNPVVSMNLTDTGNLVLFSEGNSIVWQSFANPTDSLVPGQSLILGQKLIPSVSRTNWTEHGVISLTVTSKGLYTQLETNPPQVYYKYPFIMPRNNGSATGNKSIFVEYISGGLALFGNSMVISIPVSSSYPQYLKLEFDGQLRAYNWNSQWKGMDLMKSPLGDCFSPLVCREYEICSDRQCTCPSSSSQTDEGCSEVNDIPLSCDTLSPQEQEFLELPNVTYFAFEPDLRFTTRNRCKEACANNCSCKAAFFRQCINQTGDSCPGNSCHLASRLFSLINMSNLKPKVNYTSTVYVKVQLKTVSSSGTTTTTTTDTDRSNKSRRLRKVLGLCIGALISVTVLTSLLVCIARKRGANEVEENYLDRVRGLPTRFSYGYLKAVTDNFSRKLGEGAFGSVYEGTLTDGTKGAVKRLNEFDHITKSFLAEVESIGSIHHLNLVRLVGFCAESSHRLLVYEYMSNGSLDRWIFPKSNEYVLDWRRRKNIILDIARGLNYLHRDCRQKIIHMDIKPQNILLDENFNAKVADFGLSKLIDRDQSHVVTTMRGTPGYLAPEWLSAAITEKVGVYSFGVVTLEIVCGRRVFDRSKDPEEMYLLSLLKKKAQDGRLPDLIDRSSVDVRANEWEAAGMVRVAVWCLQGDFTRRPSMSMVIKVLEGTMDVPGDLSYDFFYPRLLGEGDDVDVRQKGLEVGSTSALLPSTLSGPR